MTSFAITSACDAPLSASSPISSTARLIAPGRGRLGVIRQGDRSVVNQAYATSPLKLLTPRNHGHAAWAYTSSYGGGLVDGDRIALDIQVGPGAAAFVSTQASTKIYRSPHGTSTETHAHVATDGLLILAPDPIVPFAASRYSQVQQFDLADRASLVLIDWISSGRRAFGERWVFDEYVSRLTVRRSGRLLVHDALALRAVDGELSPRLGRFNVLAVAVMVGIAGAVVADLVAHVNASPVTSRPDQLLAATPLGDGGCVLRIAGRSVEKVGRTLRACLGYVPTMLGDDPWARKW